uniref:HTH_48 domain-containing protein n=1 Tax=Haemonchus contortus TaxID=6289 RepID=A0A7I4YET8_HAECO
MDKTAFSTVLLHEFKLGRTAKDAATNINVVWGEGTASERTVRCWFQKFRSGDESVEDEERVGRQSLVDHDVLLRAVEEDRRQPLIEDAKKMCVSHTVVAAHLELLGIVKKLGKWVPHDFTEQQQLERFEVSSSLLSRNDAESFPIVL